MINLAPLSEEMGHEWSNSESKNIPSSTILSSENVKVPSGINLRGISINICLESYFTTNIFDLWLFEMQGKHFLYCNISRMNSWFWSIWQHTSVICDHCLKCFKGFFVVAINRFPEIKIKLVIYLCDTFSDLQFLLQFWNSRFIFKTSRHPEHR